jgi:hypothetical protein
MHISVRAFFAFDAGFFGFGFFSSRLTLQPYRRHRSES